MTKPKPLPSQSEIKEAFDYDSESGLLIWKSTRSTRNGPRRLGMSAGSINTDGYRAVRWNGVKYYVHRLIWKWWYGIEPSGLDHINGDRSDNGIANLRPATPSQNSLNRRRDLRNKSGFKGVYKKGSKWVAAIAVNGNKVHLGYFDSPEEAHKTYCESAKELHGEYHRPD